MTTTVGEQERPVSVADEFAVANVGSCGRCTFRSAKVVADVDAVAMIWPEEARSSEGEESNGEKGFSNGQIGKRKKKKRIKT